MIVSSAFKENVCANCIELNKALLFAIPAVDVWSSFIVNPIPPWEADKAKALGFNKITPISGRNCPYDPDGVYPAVTLSVTLFATALPEDFCYSEG